MSAHIYLHFVACSSSVSGGGAFVSLTMAWVQGVFLRGSISSFPWGSVSHVLLALDFDSFGRHASLQELSMYSLMQQPMIRTEMLLQLTNHRL